MKFPPALLIATTLLLAACAKQTDSIKIGEYASLTGKEATFGQSAHKGIVMALEELNAAGGVLNKKLQLVSEDNQSKPGESATVAKKLITRDKVELCAGANTGLRTSTKTQHTDPHASSPAATRNASSQSSRGTNPNAT